MGGTTTGVPACYDEHKLGTEVLNKRLGRSPDCSTSPIHFMYASTCVLASALIILLGLLEHPGLYWDKNDLYFKTTALPTIVIMQIMLLILLGVDIGIGVVCLGRVKQFDYVRALGRVIMLLIMLIDATVTIVMREPHSMLLWGFYFVLFVDTVLMNKAHRAFSSVLRYIVDCIKSVSDILLMFLILTAVFIGIEIIEHCYRRVVN